MTRLRTRIWFAPGLGTSVSTISKLSIVGKPCGREASRIAGLWWFLFWACTAVFVIVTAAFLVAIFRRRTAESADLKFRRPFDEFDQGFRIFNP